MSNMATEVGNWQQDKHAAHLLSLWCRRKSTSLGVKRVDWPLNGWCGFEKVNQYPRSKFLIFMNGVCSEYSEINTHNLVLGIAQGLMVSNLSFSLLPPPSLLLFFSHPPSLFLFPFILSEHWPVIPFFRPSLSLMTYSHTIST